MRYYNVYTYSQCPVQDNPSSFPSYWVWRVEKCAQNAELPAGAIRMSLAELAQYKQNNKANFNAWVGSQILASTVVDKKVKKAVSGVNNLISKFCAENIVMGITQAGKTKLIADTFKDVFYYAQTGSLYECLTAIDAITITGDMSPFLTEARRTELKDKITNLLGNL